MSSASFSIKSTALDRELVFLDAETDYFRVELRGSSITATLRVYAFSPHMEGGLAGLFEKLGRYTQPWGGAERWESLEGEFSLEATCSAVRSIRFAVTLINRTEDWRLTTSLSSELGQLPSIASAAAQFFGE